MKRSVLSICFLLALSLSSLCLLSYKISPVYASSEQIINGGFETGDTSGWDDISREGSVSTNNTHSGIYCYEAWGYLDLTQWLIEPKLVSEISSFSIWLRSTEINNTYVVFQTSSGGYLYYLSEIMFSWKEYDLKTILLSLVASTSETFENIRISSDNDTETTAMDDLSLTLSSLSLDIQGDPELNYDFLMNGSAYTTPYNNPSFLLNGTFTNNIRLSGNSSDNYLALFDGIENEYGNAITQKVLLGVSSSTINRVGIYRSNVSNYGSPEELGSLFFGITLEYNSSLLWTSDPLDPTVPTQCEWIWQDTGGINVSQNYIYVNTFYNGTTNGDFLYDCYTPLTSEENTSAWINTNEGLWGYVSWVEDWVYDDEEKLSCVAVDIGSETGNTLLFTLENSNPSLTIGHFIYSFSYWSINATNNLTSSSISLIMGGNTTVWLVFSKAIMDIAFDPRNIASEIVHLADTGSQLGRMLGVNSFIGGLIMSAIICAIFLFPVMIFKRTLLPMAIMGFLGLAISTGLGFLPFWIDLVLLLIISILFSGKIRDAITGAGH